MSERDDLLNGPARDAHFDAIRQKIAELLQGALVVIDGQDLFAFNDDDLSELRALEAALTAYEDGLHN